MPSASAAALARCASVRNDRPVSAVRTSFAAYANALSSDIQPGEARRRDRRRPLRAEDPAPVRQHLHLPVDELAQPGDEWQAVLVVRGCLRVARLAREREVADHRDRPRRLVGALCPPRDGRGIVQCAVEREVEVDVVREVAGGGCGRDAVPAERRRPARGRARAGGGADDGEGRLLVRLVGRDAELRRPGAERRRLRRERAHVPPLGADEALHLRRNRGDALRRDLRRARAAARTSRPRRSSRTLPR